MVETKVDDMAGQKIITGLHGAIKHASGDETMARVTKVGVDAESGNGPPKREYDDLAKKIVRLLPITPTEGDCEEPWRIIARELSGAPAADRDRLAQERDDLIEQLAHARGENRNADLQSIMATNNQLLADLATLRDKLAEAEGERDEAKLAKGGPYGHALEEMADIQREVIAQLRSKLAAARAALEPFAEKAKWLQEHHPTVLDNDEIGGVHFDDLRAARKAYEDTAI